MNRPSSLHVLLGDQHVGWLVEAHGRVGFRVDPVWRERADRRVLSLSLEETGLQDLRAVPGLPAWFANLMFEGELRAWIEASEGIERHDLDFLARVGNDLLGAVTITVSSAELGAMEEDGVSASHRGPLTGRLRWSLAGVQLKLNLASRGERFTLPVHGEAGCFIAKFADRHFPDVPRIEHATMCWAAAAGLSVARTRLIRPSDIEEIPFSIGLSDEPVLLVDRFDRSADGRQRIHAEEFAQALGIRPQEKYERFGWRHHLALVARVCPLDLAEYLRRLLFVVLSGNADAHHKNWSFVFPDGRRPRLAPAYDQVCTVAWTRLDRGLKDDLPFKLNGDRRYERVSLHSVRHLMEAARVPSFVDGDRVWTPADVHLWVKGEVERIVSFRSVAEEIGGPRLREALDHHLARIPLVKDAT